MQVRPAKDVAATDGSLAEGLYRDLFDRLFQGSDAESLAALIPRIENTAISATQREAILRAIGHATALREQLSQHVASERALHAVAETARDLTELKELQQVLQTVAARGRALLGSHLAWIAGPDRMHENESHVLAADGANTEWVKEMRAVGDTGVVGHIRMTRLPFATADYYNDPRLVHDATIHSILQREGLRSVVGVPLLSGQDVLGVLILADRYARSHAPWEISTLSTLAAHAAVAIRSAQAFEDVGRDLRRSGEANARLQQQSDAAEFVAQAYERLTRIVARGGNLQEVCTAIAGLLVGRVWIVDEANTILCSASAPNGPAFGSPAEPAGIDVLDPAYQAALGTSRVQGRSVPVSGATPAAWACSIVGGGSVLGGLIVQNRHTLADVSIRVVDCGALVIAALLMAQQHRAAKAQDDASATMRELLNPFRSWTPGVLEHAGVFGLTPTSRVAVALVRVDAGNTRYVLGQLRSRFAPRSVLLDEVDGAIVALSTQHSPVELQGTLHAVLFESLKVAGTGIVARAAVTPPELPRLHATLCRCLRLLLALNRHSHIALDTELVMYAAVFNDRSDDEVLGFVSSIAGRLLEHDRRRGSQLAQTLLCYLDQGYNARAAAAQLGTHVNTLHKRLESARALIGPWDVAGRGIEIHLALRLAALARP